MIYQDKKTINVSTQQGMVRGLVESEVNVFYSMPYAQSTDGVRRFCPPQPVEKWEGVRDCFALGPHCPQLDDDSNWGNSKIISEDSLTLSVWTPATDHKQRPVMVWIHGGSLVVWGNRDPNNNGALLAKNEDVVVVTVQYRLGVFGFLHLADIGGAGFEQSGNVGFLDQAAALEWVRDNIKNFGGNPNNVTIFGQSSGADSLTTLMCMPNTQGLFHRVIHQSGCPTLCMQASRGTQIAKRAMEIAGAKTIADLQAMSMHDLLNVQEKLFNEYSMDFIFAPVVDGITLTQTTFENFAEGKQAKVPVMIGGTLDELRTWSTLWGHDLKNTDLTSLRVLWKNLFTDAQWINVMTAYFEGRTDEERENSLIRLLGDIFFRIPELRLADKMIAHQPTYVYLITYCSDIPEFKSGHCIEIPLIFGTQDQPHILQLTGSNPLRHELARTLQHTWAQFARTGNPNNAQLPEWPTYTLMQRPTMIFDIQSRVEDDPLSAERKAWEPVAYDGYSPTFDEIDTLDIKN